MAAPQKPASGGTAVIAGAAMLWYCDLCTKRLPRGQTGVVRNKLRCCGACAPGNWPAAPNEALEYDGSETAAVTELPKPDTHNKLTPAHKSAEHKSSAHWHSKPRESASHGTVAAPFPVMPVAIGGGVLVVAIIGFLLSGGKKPETKVAENKPAAVIPQETRKAADPTPIPADNGSKPVLEPAKPEALKLLTEKADGAPGAGKGAAPAVPPPALVGQTPAPVVPAAAVTVLTQVVPNDPPAAVAALEGKTHGLLGEYHTQMEWGGNVSYFVDDTIDFGDAPRSNMGFQRDNITIRWTGYVTPETSGNYVFGCLMDDGARLWVNGQLLVNEWAWRERGWLEGSVALEAGKPYPIKIEFTQGGGGACIRVHWTPPGQPRGPIPSARLTPATEAEVNAGGRMQAKAGRVTSPDTLAKSLDESRALAGKYRYTESIDLLKALKTRVEKMPWWKDQEPAWSKAFKEIGAQEEDFKNTAEDAERSASKLAVPELDKLEQTWKPRIDGAGMEQVAQAQRVLGAVADARNKLAQAEKLKNRGVLAEKFEKFEKNMKLKPTGKALEEILKGLEAFESELGTDIELADQIGERYWGLRFDAMGGKEQELSLISGQFRQMGQGAEQGFDFKDKSAFDAWQIDRPQEWRTGEKTFDSKLGILNWKVSNGNGWWEGGRSELPVLKLPFYFRPEVWTIEALLCNQMDQPDKDRPHFGLWLWDGGMKYMFFKMRDQTREPDKNKDRDMEFQAFGFDGAKYEPPLQKWKGKPHDWTRFVVNCNNGNMSVQIYNGNKSEGYPKVPLKFNPLFVCLVTMGVNGDHPSGTLQAKYVKITGIPDTARLKELWANKRNSYVLENKALMMKRFGTEGIARAERISFIPEWWNLWTIEAKNDGDSQRRCEYAGRKDVYGTHPISPEKPCTFKRRIQLDAGKKWYFTADTHSNGGNDFVARLLVNGDKLFDKVICNANEWVTLEADLSAYAGKTVDIELQHAAGGANLWAGEHGWWDKVRVYSK